MPAYHGSLSASNTGDGDLGLLAMQSSSPSTSFEPADHADARAAALTAIPAYPGTPPAEPPSTALPFTDPSASSPGVQLQPALAPSTSSSAPSAGFASLSLEDELGRPNTPRSDLAPATSPPCTLPVSHRNRQHLHTNSHSSSSDAYTSAAESPASDRAHRNPPAPARAIELASAAPLQAVTSSSTPPNAPPASVSQQSIASVSTIKQARLPTSRSLASHVSADKHALSLEQELDADHDAESSSNAHDSDTRTSHSAALARSSRRSRRSGLPPPQDRLPVGEGGPHAPPRNASFRDASKRLSVGAGYGDLGVDAYAPSFIAPSSPSMTSFLDLDSPRTSESSTTGRYNVPSRRTSLHAPSPRTSTFPIPPGSAPAPPSSSSDSRRQNGQKSSRPGSSTSKTARAATQSSSSPAASVSTHSPGTATPASSLKLDREAMQRWVLSVGCVNFDLELGPDLEFLYPPLGISREERDNIAFSSFPDTSIFDDGSLVFSWRVREVPLDSSGSEPPTIKSIGDALQPAATAMDEETPRPSMNKAALQNALAKAGKKPPTGNLSVPTSPTSPAEAGFRDSSASSATSSHGLSRQTSDANLQGAAAGPTSGLPSTTSFHERLTQKLFSSNSSAMARHFSHDRHSSTHSMSSASADDDGEAASAAKSGSASVGTASNASPGGSMIASGSAPGSAPGSEVLPKRVGNSTSSSYIYGYVFFRQKRDPTNRRGYFQKSVVILSHLPLVGLFSEVVARLGPLYFEHGMSMFEAFAHDIMAWPAPQPGTILTLPLLGSILTAAIPFGQQPQNSPSAESAPMAVSHSAPGGFRNTATMTIRSRSRQASGNRELPEPLIGPEGPLLASVPATSLFDTFKEALGDLWLLWECVLLAEPILVIAPEPKIASEAVWHMLDLIRPIPYAGDFRPYFHIHDYDFRTLVTKNKPQAGTLVAATNPFFATACGHWPHVLRVGKAAVKLITFKHNPNGGAGGAKKGPTVGGGIGGGHGAGGGGPDHIPGFTTKRKRRISKDRQLLKRLQDLAAAAAKSGGGDEAVQAACQAANVTMRRYFADLTERFLAPLNRYVASLVPASFDLGSPSEVPKIRPFNTTDFLASLKAHGTPLAIRSRSLPTGASVRQSVYVDFLRCPNFSLWLHSRVAAAEEEQRRRYIASLMQGDVTAFGSTRGEIETIDLYSRLVEEIRLVDVQLTTPTEPGPGSRWRTDTPAPAKDGTATPNKAVVGNTTEKRLRDQKAKLMQQLDRLCQTLPADLRSSLRRPA
ncbi:DUF1630-domain-containing protein [Moesziomyces antarcticus]|uniref:UDENN domain-containing protein n=1 Tax=Pseudozyma antarctica TaxID=84753 RepID=A0A5C3FEC6_PSEA2|nr:DUF1630-domain-containing protein [Moesziomyces antarcticus]GAK62227.1 DUF1630-domain-containing protein [Moesziomyces antarcticus]SPO42764.1 uncharacterized protein PSANT_00447 [Moesziomyces antarcticus]